MGPIEGWHGWGEYAPFYDWENARTGGRRNIRFCQRLAGQCGGPVLELGCGTGQVAVPVARTVDGVFRTLSLRQMTGRLRRAGFTIETVSGDYRGGPWHLEAESWIVVVRKMG